MSTTPAPMSPEDRRRWERGVLGILPRPIGAGAYDVREMQNAFHGGPIPGESFGLERFAHASKEAR